MGNKSQNIKYHFKMRIKERLNVYVNEKAIKEIKDYIVAGKAELIEKQTNTRRVFKIPILPLLKRLNLDIKHSSFLVVYDSNRHLLVTCMECKNE